MPSFGPASRKALNTCVPPLIHVAEAAIEIVDFSILVGHRTKPEQDLAYRQGNTLLQWPDGPHNKMPSVAFDFAPYIEPWGILVGSKGQIDAIAKKSGKLPIQVNAWIRERYFEVIGVIRACAHRLDVPIRSGSDWNSDGDGNLFDQVKLDDLPHIEYRPK